jgi:hypothetical protein
MRLCNTRFFLLVLVSLLGACSDDSDKKACPSSGLGAVSEVSGKSCKGLQDPTDPDLQDCQQQMENAKQYDCKEPQICFDRTVERALNFIIAKEAPEYSLSFILSNCSTGNQKLVISSVEVLGNQSCHFSFDITKDLQKQEVSPGDQTLIQVRYLPTKPSQDHLVLKVTSNAQNFPELRLFACGFGVPKYPAGQDSGSPVYVDLGTYREAGFAGMECKDQTKPSTCN